MNTLSAAFTQKILTVQPRGASYETKIKLQIWDTAGAEEYRSINQLYYKKAAIVLLVYSTTDFESFDDLAYWHQELDQQADQNTIKFVVGSKIDITEVDDDCETVPKHTAAEFAKKINAQFFLTSAKENLGINKMFQTAAEMCSQHMELRNDNDVS